MNRVAIYARVSTEGKMGTDGQRLKGQTVDPQLLELREWCARMKWTVVGEWTDVMSGTKAARPGLDALLSKCETGEIDAVVVVKLDRLGRSLLNVVKLVEDLDELGVAVICTSQGIDTRKDSPCGRMILQIMAAFAEFEKSLISERTIAGLAAAKARGSIVGKVSPVGPVGDARAVVIADWRTRTGGKGLRLLAKMLGGVSIATAAKWAREYVPATMEEAP